jgi:hypothetical protein
MSLVGLVITLVGFLSAVASLGMSASVGGRLIFVLVGIAVSLAGSLGVITQAYQKNAVWKK